MNKTIVPQNWKSSLEELRRDMGETVERWLGRLRPEQRREAETALSSNGSLWNPVRFGWDPNLQLYDGEDELRVTADLPGLSKGDFKVELDGRYLTIMAERSHSSERKENRVHISERSYGSFSRVLPLPCEVEGGKAKAKYKNGVLTVTLPKSEEAKAHRKQVKVS